MMYIGHYDWQLWLQVFDWNGQIKNIRQYGSNIYKNARFSETTENQTVSINGSMGTTQMIQANITNSTQDDSETTPIAITTTESGTETVNITGN